MQMFYRQGYSQILPKSGRSQEIITVHCKSICAFSKQGSRQYLFKWTQQVTDVTNCERQFNKTGGSKSDFQNYTRLAKGKWEKYRNEYFRTSVKLLDVGRNHFSRCIIFKNKQKSKDQDYSIFYGMLCNNKKVVFSCSRDFSLHKLLVCKMNCQTYSRYHTTTRNFVESEQADVKSLRTQPPWRVLFFGTDGISLATLQALHGNLISSGNLVESLEVVTMHPEGQKSLPVNKFATKAGLNVHGWPIKVSHIKERFDVGVLVSFGHMIPDRVIKPFPYGIMNMHPSLLPRWRGASPIFHTVLNGDTETGVTISDIRPKHFDVGPILMQRNTPVLPRITTGELTNQLAKMGASLVLECLKDLPNLERLEVEQKSQGITYAHKIDPVVSTLVNWEHQTAREIDCQFRALQGYGSLRLTSHMQNGEPVSFTEMVDPELTKGLDWKDLQYRWGNFSMAAPGCVALKKQEKWLLVKCKDSVAAFTKVICRSHMSGYTFYSGFCNHRHTQVTFRSEDNQLNKYMYVERVPTPPS